MTSFRLKQIGLVLCLMASLLTASPAACTCSHHEETKATETDCNSHHESEEIVDATETGDSVEDSCVCFVNQRSPYVASKAESKNLRSGDSVINSEQNISGLEFITVVAFRVASPEFTNAVSYSYTLKSLLPSRAPPRL